MMANKTYLQRKSPRLSGYDYARPGAYFVTVCTQNRTHLFGTVEQGIMHLNDAGRIVHEVWQTLPDRFAAVRLDAFVVMPNHVHGIVWVIQENGPDSMNATNPGAVSRGAACCAPTVLPDSGPDTAGLVALPDVMRAFKSISAIQTNRILQRTGVPVWQRSYYDHIVRHDEALNRIRHYIQDNPKRWSMDRYNPEPIGPDPLAAEIWRMLQNP